MLCAALWWVFRCLVCVECAFTSLVSIESCMLGTCHVQYAMSVSTVWKVFATVMCLVLPMCILTSCSSVLCVWMALVCLCL